MLTDTEIYQSILASLSKLPPAYLHEVDSYLRELSGATSKGKALTEKPLMKFGSTWDGFTDEDFNEMLEEARKAGNSIIRTAEKL